jgi:hypothetical protein
MAGAAADFAELAAEGTEDAFLEEGAIGDALLASRAAEAARSVVERRSRVERSATLLAEKGRYLHLVAKLE